jgi:hypothetical protein
MGQRSLMLFFVGRSVIQEILEEVVVAYIKAFEPLVSEREGHACRQANLRDCETYDLIMLSEL